MLWIERLNNHLSGFLTPPGTARHLGEQGKRPLRSRKIGQHEGDISRDDSNQRYSWQIESLGNHLCAHQYIGLAVGETVEQLLVSAPVFGCVAIPEQDAFSRMIGQRHIAAVAHCHEATLAA